MYMIEIARWQESCTTAMIMLAGWLKYCFRHIFCSTANRKQRPAWFQSLYMKMVMEYMRVILVGSSCHRGRGATCSSSKRRRRLYSGSKKTTKRLERLFGNFIEKVRKYLHGEHRLHQSRKDAVHKLYSMSATIWSAHNVSKLCEN